jgi:hypothetical protein
MSQLETSIPASYKASEPALLLSSPPVNPCEHYLPDSSLEQALGLGQRIIQTSAVLQLVLIQWLLHDELRRGSAATLSHGINLKGNSGGSTDGKRDVTFQCSHADSIAF